MGLRLFVHIDDHEEDCEVAAFDALAIPTRGDRIWVKTSDFEGHAIVRNIEHQFDRSRPETYDSQDVILYCTSE